VQPASRAADPPGMSRPAIPASMDWSCSGSTLSAAIKVRTSGSDKALLNVNSCLEVLMVLSFVFLPQQCIALTTVRDSR
jgi:hypothetical protein